MSNASHSPDRPVWPDPSRRTRLARRLRGVRRGVLARRRPLAALLAAGAVLTTIRVAAPQPEPTVEVQVAARDLPSGTRISSGDLRAVSFRPESVPAGVAPRVVGRTLAAPVRRGEPVTDVRLVGKSLTAGLPGLVAAPVRLPDSDSVDLLSVGDRIDLVSADGQRAMARTIAVDVPVLALPSHTAGDTRLGGSGPAAGRLVVVGVSAADAGEVAQATVSGYLTFTFSD